MHVREGNTVCSFNLGEITLYILNLKLKHFFVHHPASNILILLFNSCYLKLVWMIDHLPSAALIAVWQSHSLKCAGSDTASGNTVDGDLRTP